MTDPKSVATEPPAAPHVKRPGHRAADVRDTVAEMTAKAREITEEAGSRMGSAMKELITAAAGLAGFAVESARDLVQFMVRRGQMTQEEADKLMKEVEASQPKRKAPPPTKTIANTAAPSARKAPPTPAPQRPAPTVSRPAEPAAKAQASAKTASAKKAAPVKAPASAAKAATPAQKSAGAAKAPAKAPVKAAAKAPPKAANKAAAKPAPKKAPAKSAGGKKTPKKATGNKR